MPPVAWAVMTAMPVMPPISHKNFRALCMTWQEEI
jgi:hypothetical protein